jgi:hypothetical protein
MEAERISETSVNFYRLTRLGNSKDDSFYISIFSLIFIRSLFIAAFVIIGK